MAVLKGDARPWLESRPRTLERVSASEFVASGRKVSKASKTVKASDVERERRSMVRIRTERRWELRAQRMLIQCVDCNSHRTTRDPPS